MSKIKKFFTTIISAIVVFFVKTGFTNADVMIPSNNGRYIPQSMYGVYAPPIGFRIVKFLNPILLLIVLPPLILVGIYTLVEIKKKEKEQRTNTGSNNEITETTEVMELKRRLKKLIIATIIVSVVIVVLFFVIKIWDDNLYY